MVKFRKARKEDWKTIKLLISLFPQKLMVDHLPNWNNFFVAEDKGEIIGCCALDIYSKRIAEIRSLVVVSEYQNKGVGTKLVQLCIKRAKEKRIMEIIAITGKEKLLHKLGFNAFNNERMALFKIM